MSASGLARVLFSSKTALRVAALAAFCIAVVAALRIGPWTTFDQVLVFVLAPAAVAAAMFALSRAAPAVRANTILALVSVTAALFVSELALQYFSRPFARVGGDWVAGPGAARLRELRAQNTRAYPNIPAQTLRTFRLGAEQLQPLSPTVSDAVSLMCDELDVPVTYPPTGFGFNNPTGVWEADSLELAIVGDSYTQGVCVPFGQAFADGMRATWPKLINVGVAGSGPLFQLGLLKEYVAPKRPAVVLWVYYEGNDLRDLGLEENDERLLRYLQPGFSQGLMARQPQMDSLLASLMDSLMAELPSAETGILRPNPTLPLRDIASESVRLASLRQMAGIGALVPRKTSSLRILPQVLGEAQRTVESWGGEIVLVYLPAYLRFYSWLGDPFRGRNEVLALADSLGIETIDLVPVFEGMGSPRSLWAHPRGHLSPEGYAFVGDVLTERLAALASPP